MLLSILHLHGRQHVYYASDGDLALGIAILNAISSLFSWYLVHKFGLGGFKR